MFFLLSVFHGASTVLLVLEKCMRPRKLYIVAVCPSWAIKASINLPKGFVIVERAGPHLDEIWQGCQSEALSLHH